MNSKEHRHNLDDNASDDEQVTTIDHEDNRVQTKDKDESFDAGDTEDSSDDVMSAKEGTSKEPDECNHLHQHDTSDVGTIVMAHRSVQNNCIKHKKITTTVTKYFENNRKVIKTEEDEFVFIEKKLNQ